MIDNIDKIHIYGDPVLKRSAEKITAFDESLRELADRMVEFMYAHNGIGFAGPQAGVSMKISVIDLSFGEEVDNTLIIINPEILKTEGKCTMEEGCLSVPGIFEDVERPEKIKVRYQDLDGTVHEREADGLLARVILHEVDHLKGILFVGRLSTVKRKLLSKKLRTLAKEGNIG